MGNINTSLATCIVCDTDAGGRKMEEEREVGQSQLWAMILNEEEIDWSAVIAKADALHRREQAWLRRRSRREQLLFQKRQRKALEKRRRYDAIGSFNVNLVTFRLAEIHPTDDFVEVDTSFKSAVKSSTSTGSSRDEEFYGFSDIHLVKNQDKALDPIDERAEASDTVST
jgi:hypothetical protein